MLEGDEAIVSDLYARIQYDARHTWVETVRAGLGERQFAGWDMAFRTLPLPMLGGAVAALQGKQTPPRPSSTHCYRPSCGRSREPHGPAPPNKEAKEQFTESMV